VFPYPTRGSVSLVDLLLGVMSSRDSLSRLGVQGHIPTFKVCALVGPKIACLRKEQDDAAIALPLIRRGFPRNARRRAPHLKTRKRNAPAERTHVRRAGRGAALRSSTTCATNVADRARRSWRICTSARRPTPTTFWNGTSGWACRPAARGGAPRPRHTRAAGRLRRTRR